MIAQSFVVENYEIIQFIKTKEEEEEERLSVLCFGMNRVMKIWAPG